MANMKLNIVMEGSKEIAAAYKKISYVDKSRMIQKAATRVLRPVMKRAKSNLRSRTKKRTGNLYRSIRLVKEKRMYVGAWIKPRRVSGRYKGYHSSIIESGTEQRKTKKGADRGRVKATNFWSDAQLSTEIMDRRFERYIVYELNKYFVKHGGRK